MAVEQLLGLVGAGRDPGALAQLQDRLLRGRPVAARAGDEDLRLGRRRLGERERLGDRRRRARRSPRRGARRSRRRRRCSSRCGTSERSSSGVQTITSSASSASGESAVPVTSHFGPGNARAASSVSGVPPSCETQTIRSASRRGEHGLERLQRDRRRSAPRGTTSRSRRRPTRAPVRQAEVASAPPRATRAGRTRFDGSRQASRVLYTIAAWPCSNGQRSPTGFACSPRRCRTPSRSPVSSCSRPARATSAPRTAASRTSPSTCSSRARSAARPRAT